MERQTKIQQFYEDKVVLLTGGTGFLGMLIVEKLLRTCDVKKLYLLVRDKRGRNAEDRVHAMLENQIFQGLSETCQNFRDKILPITSDLSKPDMGLSLDDSALILNEVNLIFHCAASIRFDEDLRTAVTNNVISTKNICLLAQKIKKLQALIYVSTIYTNCQYSLIEEKVYSCDNSPDEIIAFVKSSDSKSINSMTKNMLSLRPNTYVYSKCVSENVVNEFGASLPVAIFRPSIVTATITEPLPGWLKNANGVSLVIETIHTGLLKSLQIDHEATANIVPADMTANAIIALGYCVGIESHRILLLGNKDKTIVPVVNYVSPTCNKLTWVKFFCCVLMYIKMCPLNALYWYPVLYKPRNNVTAAMQHFFLHSLPSIAFNIFGGKRQSRAIKIFNKIQVIRMQYPYFCTKRWTFEEQNIKVLWNFLEDEEKRLFFFNLEAVDWLPYIYNYVQGVRKYILLDDPETLPTARKKLKRWYYIHKLTTFSVSAILIILCLNITGLIDFKIVNSE